MPQASRLLLLNPTVRSVDQLDPPLREIITTDKCEVSQRRGVSTIALSMVPERVFADFPCSSNGTAHRVRARAGLQPLDD